MRYIIGAKPGDHKYLFEWIADLKPRTYLQIDEQGTEHHFHATMMFR